jgi:hypothetical protein
MEPIQEPRQAEPSQADLDALKAFLGSKIGIDYVSKHVNGVMLRFLFMKGMVDEGSLKGLRFEDIPEPPFTRGVQNQLFNQFKGTCIWHPNMYK